MKIRLLCIAILVMLLIPMVCVGDGGYWYCPQCGRRNDGNYCPYDGTARPSDLAASAYSTPPTYYFSAHSLDFPHKLNCAVYTGPGTEYLRGANGTVQFISQSFKYAGLDGDWLLVRCQVRGGGTRYGYIDVSAYQQTVWGVQHLVFSDMRTVVSRDTKVWDSMMDEDLGPICYLPQGTPVTYLCNFVIDGMNVAYIEVEYNYRLVRGFVYPSCLR